MDSLSVPAYAKLNLTLDVLGKRPDGYHDLVMVMQSVSLADTLTIRKTDAPDLRLTSNLSFLPGEDKNLAAVAARAFAARTGVSLAGLELTLDKRIPVCAGTAGGSSDAAAALRGLNRWFGTGLSLETMKELGAQVGSDVPYCVLGGTALAEGRGERLTVLPDLPDCWAVLCKPGFSVSTPELFQRLDGVKLRFHPDTAGVRAALAAGDLAGVCRRMFNVFEQVLPPRRRTEIEEIKEAMLETGALGACMTGTGPTVFGIYDDPSKAQTAADRLKETWSGVFLTQSVAAPANL